MVISDENGQLCFGIRLSYKNLTCSRALGNCDLLDWIVKIIYFLHKTEYSQMPIRFKEFPVEKSLKKWSGRSGDRRSVLNFRSFFPEGFTDIIVGYLNQLSGFCWFFFPVISRIDFDWKSNFPREERRGKRNDVYLVETDEVRVRSFFPMDRLFHLLHTGDDLITQSSRWLMNVIVLRLHKQILGFLRNPIDLFHLWIRNQIVFW